LGNGEVDSSILSGGTIHSLLEALKIKHNSRFRPVVGFSHISYFGRNRPRKHVPTDTKLAQRFAFCPLIQTVQAAAIRFTRQGPLQTA
jgi:hypothetical protein